MAWRQRAEREAVADGQDVPKPAWHSDDVPRRVESCIHHDGKRCELLGSRADGVCEPVVSGMAALLKVRP